MSLSKATLVALIILIVAGAYWISATATRRIYDRKKAARTRRASATFNSARTSATRMAAIRELLQLDWFEARRCIFEGLSQTIELRSAIVGELTTAGREAHESLMEIDVARMPASLPYIVAIGGQVARLRGFIDDLVIPSLVAAHRFGDEGTKRTVMATLHQLGTPAAVLGIKQCELHDLASEATQVSVNYPCAVEPETWQSLIAYVFRVSSKGLVVADAKSRLEPRYDEIQEADTNLVAQTPPGVTILVRPELQGFRFAPSEIAVEFREKWHRLEFAFRSTGPVTFTHAHGAVSFVANGVNIADIPLTVEAISLSQGLSVLTPKVLPQTDPENRQVTA